MRLWHATGFAVDTRIQFVSVSARVKPGRPAGTVQDERVGPVVRARRAGAIFRAPASGVGPRVSARSGSRRVRLCREALSATLDEETRSGPCRGFMLTNVGRVLAFVCVVVLALPSGWCCQATAGGCCGPALPSAPAPASAGCCTSEACASKTCARSCCSKETADERPAPAPTQPKPNRPCDTACCEQAPTIAPKVELPVDLEPVGIRTTFTETVDPEAEVVSVGVPPRSAFPPLHVLHCVWLC